ncbi:hypothetical protein A4H97_26875 [Niastella yeongjuensis]|uniref:Uncharacterized protein n=1 Tax=Niastella yeongjuensis TaxID=354355 RepID=A0A1V9F0G0_9BACT|nr:hypothetical protein A4H97_26875 [Niastella yeongjuensis]
MLAFWFFIPDFQFTVKGLQKTNVNKKLLLAAPKYSFYFVPKGIRLFYLLAFIHQIQADTAMWDRRVDFPDNF